MAKLWKGLRGIVKKDNKYPSELGYSVFSKEMTLKLVFVGGHQSGKTSIVRILNKQKFSTDYDPTIGIDQHKIKLENTEIKESLWIWDVSHAELGGVHEPLIFHQAHGIVLVADLTNFTNIQAIDQWLHSISVYLKRLLESQQLTVDDDDDDNDEENENEQAPDLEDEAEDLRNDFNGNELEEEEQKYSQNKFKLKSKSKPKPKPKSKSTQNSKNKHKNILIPRLYLLITKYDLSDEPILTDTQLHKFCKSNSIRAFARISAKLDRRSEMLDIFSKFSQDIIKHLPSKTPYHILQEENDRFRYNYAIRRLQRNKIDKHYYDDREQHKKFNTIFDLRLHSIKTFKWHTSAQAIDDAQHSKQADDEEEEDESDEEREDFKQAAPHSVTATKRKKQMDRRLLAQNKLREVELEAKRVLVSMRESIKLQRQKTMRDAREYQKNLLKLKAMNQLRQEQEYKYKNDRENHQKNESKIIDNEHNVKQQETLLNHDVITSLKLDMITALQQEVENLTQIWEDELNTILELIRFQMPLQRINANLHRLSQQIIAREMLFRRRIRLVSELRTQNRFNISQMIMMKQEEQNVVDANDADKQHVQQNVVVQEEEAQSMQAQASTPSISVINSKKSSFFSSLVAKNENVEALP